TALTVTECNSYTWTSGDGQTYTQSGNYLYSHTDANGCTQVDTLHLTVFHPQHTALTVTECNSYTWTAGDGHTYTQSGNYLYSHTDANGCTQVDTLHLTVFHPQHTALTVNECGSYTWASGDGHTYTQSGNYLYSHTDANGCTQIDTLHLTIRPIPVVTITGNGFIHLYESATLTAHGADSYVWSTGAHSDAIIVSPTSATTYSVTGYANGCTSAPASVTVEVGACIPAQGVENITTCGNFTWHGHTYHNSSTATHTIPNGAASGCDSIVTLHLTIFHPQHSSLTITECNSYTWTAGDGQTYTQSGIYLHSHTDANGCTQVDTLHLTLFHPQHTSLSVSECDSYTWASGDGHTYFQSGTYLHSHTDANGCTQVDTLHLTIKPIPAVTITGNGFIHLYESTTLTAHGADSYVWSTGAHSDAITVSPTSATTYSVTGYADGCTSAPASITINVGACIPAQGVETVTACGSFTWYGQTYHNSSTATHTIPNGAASGCDSIVTLYLTIYHVQHTATTANECGSYTWSSGDGQTYTQSGTYLHSHTDANGCTQVDTLHLTIRPVPVVSISGNTAIHLYESTTLTASGANSYSWSTGASTDAIIVSPASTTTYSVTGTTDGCASAPASVTVTVGPCIPAQGVETVTACESYTWHGQTYYESTDTATHTVIGGAATGCDSIVTLHLTIHHAQHTATTASECGSFTWSAGDGQTYNQSGTYLYSHTDTNGCTQVDTLLLTIFEPQSSEFTVATEDSCYDWNGTEYCENGDFTQTLTDQFGCDSTITLHLTLRVGITQYDEQYNISIYPNPTTSILYIESDAQIGQIHLYNTFGQKIKSIRVDGTKRSLDLSDLATGAYYLSVETDKGIVVKKVIRNK
ncbi:MAG: T9SS type A sorting domain-containing protein, partial [Bacteroidales bacterium]|nr:T9SS type A sorting domain-containing protein [Bacteroidales bacterium]